MSKQSIILKKICTISITVLGLVALYTALPHSAHSNVNDIGITIAPITDEFAINPGEVVTRSMFVLNPSIREVTLYPIAIDFNTDNEDGQPVFFFSKEDDGIGYTMSRWISFEKNFIEVDPGEQKEFIVTFSAPSNAEPGGRYGAVLLSTEQPEILEDGSPNIGIVGLVGTLILATVPGDIKEHLEIEKFDMPRFVFGSPIEIAMRFRNDGNVHQKPTGNLVIRNWSGNQVDIIPINTSNGNVLPESKRVFGAIWSFGSLERFGIYRVTAELTYGSQNTELRESGRILILPYWAVVALTLIITSIIYVAIRKIFFRKYKKKSS